MSLFSTPMTTEFAPDYPKVLSDLAGLFQQRLGLALPRDQATELALALVEEVRRQWGGGLIYIPKGDRHGRSQRDAAIWRAFDGHNHAELAHHYRLTVSCIYDIVARERARQQNEIFSCR
jgi:Mor family transcriptional regulator